MKNFNSENIFHVIGIMSGTSLDGLDLAYCIFQKQESKWTFDVVLGETIPYSDEWKLQLNEIGNKSALEFVKFDCELGHFIGRELQLFINKNKLKPDLVCSHGHTIFHQPNEGFTTQIGSGSVIRSYIGIPLVFDFRSLDVALNGQGAPLVPIGDELLFSDYDYCLNLGGISNVSYKHQEKRIAFDISPCNMALNYLANKLNLPYDKDGQVASLADIDISLYQELNSLDYYKIKGPKTLGREWFEESFMPELSLCSSSIHNKLRTVTEHIAFQITNSLSDLPKGKLIITGGGALNSFLIKKMKEQTLHEVVIPHESIINYKEALIFAFLGLLKMRGETNSLASVTGARVNSSSGCIV